jgi:dihydroflavonol-4-reductase
MAVHVVTGAAGFIGSAVVRKLVQRGEQVRAVLEPGANAQNLEGLAVERVSADVRDHEAMLRALQGAETLYHLAAIYKVWTPDPAALWNVNIDGTVATLLAAQKAQVPKVVYTSSISALGKRADGAPSTEETPFNLWDIANDYVLSKHLSDNIALDFARAGVPVTVVLPGFPFGPRDVAPTPTGGIILSIMRGQVPALFTGSFSAIDVDDCAEGHLLAAEKGRVGERYILSSHNVTFSDFVALVCKVAGSKPPKLRLPKSAVIGAAFLYEQWARKKGEAPPATIKATQYMHAEISFDNRKAREELGLPVTPLEASVRRAVEWFRANGAA